MNNSSLNNQIKENLNKWDELSPLRNAQVKSILVLSQLNQFQLNENDLTTPSTQTDSGTNLAGQSPQRNVMHKVIKQNNFTNTLITLIDSYLLKINEDINELLYNFDVNDIEDAKIEKYVNNLNKNSKKCSQINDAIGAALGHLNVLLENYSQVSQKTGSLHVACEQLLNDQVLFEFKLALALYYLYLWLI